MLYKKHAAIKPVVAVVKKTECFWQPKVNAIFPLHISFFTYDSYFFKKFLVQSQCVIMHYNVWKRTLILQTLYNKIPDIMNTNQKTNLKFLHIMKKIIITQLKFECILNQLIHPNSQMWIVTLFNFRTRQLLPKPWYHKLKFWVVFPQYYHKQKNNNNNNKTLFTWKNQYITKYNYLQIAKLIEAGSVETYHFNHNDISLYR